MEAVERSFDAVFFDWCGTLVRYPHAEERIRPVLESLGRPADDADVTRIAGAFREAESHPASVEADENCDLSAEQHAETKRVICEIAGIDDELGEAIERSFGDLDTYETYPEVVGVLTHLSDHGIKLAIVSDFHVDLRPHLESLGILDRISAFAISCEVGVTKPDPLMFEVALARTGTSAPRCLMVGDNPGPDCGAAALGITTLILPVHEPPRPPLLRRVVDLVLAGGR